MPSIKSNRSFEICLTEVEARVTLWALKHVSYLTTVSTSTTVSSPRMEIINELIDALELEGVTDRNGADVSVRDDDETLGITW